MDVKTIYDIKEDKVKIEGKAWDSDDSKQLGVKKILQLQKMLAVNQEYFLRGERFFDMFDGKILTTEQRNTYENVEEKIVLEPPIMKAPIRALVGNIIKSRRSGSVVTEGGDYEDENSSAAETKKVNIILKDIENKTGEKYKIRNAINDTFVSCYMGCLYFDKRRPDESGEGKFKLKQLPWNSFVVGPLKHGEADGSDIKEMMWYEPRTQAELEDNFPDMVQQIRDHVQKSKDTDASMMSSLKEWEGNFTVEERDSLFSIIDNATSSMTSSNGFIPTVQHLFPIRRKEEVWLHKYDDSKFEVRPPEWDEERWNNWIQENKENYFGPAERTVVTLWTTVFTLTGLVLSNKKHWFQENGMLPASFWIADIINGKLSGPVKDMADDCLANCVGQIEYLDDLRKGSGNLMLFREGSITNIEDLPVEVNKATGFAFVSKDFEGPMRDAVHEVKRIPNTHWDTWASQRQDSMSKITQLNETMQGAPAPRQAAIAKNIEITQALIVNALYIDNANRCWEYHQNLKCLLIAYGYNEWDVIEVTDEVTKETHIAEVNNPVEWDDEGNVTKVENDLTSHRYRWKISPVDDSPSAKAMMMQEALVAINAAAGPLLGHDPSGKMFARFLMAMDNSFLKEAGKAMAEDAKLSSESQGKQEEQQALREAAIEMTKAKAEMLKAQKQGVNLTFKAEDLVNFPKMFEYYNQIQAMFNVAAEQGSQQSQEQIPQEQGMGGQFDPMAAMA